MESLLFTEYKIDRTRINLYFDKYKYKLCIRADGFQFFRNIKNIESYDVRLYDRVGNFRYESRGNSTTVKDRLGENVEVIKEILGWMIDQKSKSDKNLKFVTALETLTIYFNDKEIISNLLTLIDSLPRSDTEFRIELLEAEKLAGYQKGIIYQINPKHKYRLHFGFFRLNKIDIQILRSYLKNPENKLHLNSTARTWMSREIVNNFWYGITVDCDDDVHATYLNMLYPGIINKLSKIEKRINTV